MSRLNQRPRVEMTGGHFVADMVARIKWAGHGYTSQIQHLKLIQHGNGDIVAVNMQEWRTMAGPLLVKRKNQWYFADYPVDVQEVSETAKEGIAVRNRRRSNAGNGQQLAPPSP